MWISKLDLTCFKGYQSQTFVFPEPENGKNIVLIGGLNGYGKTSILEALYLCLYGKDAIVHLARAGLKTEDKKGYPTFLERAFNGEAIREGLDTMIVRVIINKTKTKAVDISRKWYFRSNGNWTGEEETIVRDIIRGIPDNPRTDGKSGFNLADLLDEVFVPAHIAPFFFFDGEEVKKLADQSRIEQVKQGLEGLLGVVLLRELAERLKNFENLRKSEVVNVDEGNLIQLRDTLQKNEEQLAELKFVEEQNEQSKNRLRATQESLIGRITTMGGGGGGIATVKELVEEREQTRNDLKNIRKKLEEILADRLPFHLCSKSLVQTFQNQLNAEIKFYDWEKEKQTLEPKKAQFQESFLKQNEPSIEPPLNDEQLSAIKTRLESAWTSLFYPPPDDCAKEIIHRYLHEPFLQNVISFLGSTQLSRQEITNLLNEEHLLQQKDDNLGRKISQLEGLDRDGTLSKLKQEMLEIQSNLKELDDQIRSDDRKIIGLVTQVNSQRAEYERERKKLDEFSPLRSLIQKSERVRKVIEEVIPELFPLKVGDLAKAMTKVYKQLAHKNQVDKIEISDDGTTRILGKTGNTISFDRSAGENQIFATALLAGLSKVSGVNAPMVVDTPLGRLDSKHRENILLFWTGDKTRQVILLSQDEEIDYHFYSQIEDSVGKTYLLEHLDVGDGIGRTSAVENQYFARGRR